MACLFFKTWVIVDYLKFKDKLDSKDTELLIALSLIKFHEKQWGCKCCVGLELKDKYSRDFPEDSFSTLPQLQMIISKKIENDTPVDIFISKEDAEHGSRGYGFVRKGASYQIKRFGKNEQNKTEDLLNLLNNSYKKISKNDANLLIFLETSQEIDFKYLQDHVDTADYPFKKIMFMAKIDKKLSIGEIWPNPGMNEFDFNNLLEDI